MRERTIYEFEDIHEDTLLIELDDDGNLLFGGADDATQYDFDRDTARALGELLLKLTQ
jgi:hypothetical protein